MGDSNAFPRGQSNQSKTGHLKIHTNNTWKKFFFSSLLSPKEKNVKKQMRAKCINQELSPKVGSLQNLAERIAPIWSAIHAVPLQDQVHVLLPAHCDTEKLQGPKLKCGQTGLFPAVNSYERLPCSQWWRSGQAHPSGTTALHPGREDAELPHTSTWDSEMILQRSLWSENFTAKCEWISAIYRVRDRTGKLWNYFGTIGIRPRDLAVCTRHPPTSHPRISEKERKIIISP